MFRDPVFELKEYRLKKVQFIIKLMDVQQPAHYKFYFTSVFKVYNNNNII